MAAAQERIRGENRRLHERMKSTPKINSTLVNVVHSSLQQATHATVSLLLGVMLDHAYLYT